MRSGLTRELRENRVSKLMFNPYLCVCWFWCDLSWQTKDNIGLAGGGQKVAQCREKYKQWVENLIKLASLQTSFVTMDEALKVGCCMRTEYPTVLEVSRRFFP